MSDTTPTKEQWIERYAQRIVKHGRLSVEAARIVARNDYRVLAQDDADPVASPEDAADEEMSYWSDDR